MGYVFISYSSKNLEYADAMRNLLKNIGVKTWMAPGDIPAGSTYAGVITRALKGSDCLVLLLTDDSQKSTWVDKEVERALSYGKTIIPVALESLTLNDNFEFYLGNQQIVPVKQISRDNKEFQKIIDQVLKLTGTEVTEDYSNSSIEYEQKELEHLNYDEPTYRTVSMGAYNYFHKGGKKEIIWDIISEEEGKTLLISKFGLDTKQFSMQRDKTWADCSLRRWLNDDFFQGAFSDIEKAAIIETQVLPDQNAEFDTNAGEPCKDRVFVLSKSEIDKYNVSTNDMCCKPTEYAKSRGAFTWGKYGCCLWWLRTPGNKSNMISYINAAGGYTGEGCYAQRSEVCVRPAMRVYLSLLR